MIDDVSTQPGYTLSETNRDLEFCWVEWTTCNLLPSIFFLTRFLSPSHTNTHK